jgi:hypothetical protein
MRQWHLWLCPLLLLSAAASPEDLLDYCNSNLPIEQRAADLAQRTILEQKVVQLAGGRRRVCAQMGREAAQIFGKLQELYQVEATASPYAPSDLANTSANALVS